MRKLLILAAVAIVAPTGMGCQCGPVRNWLCRNHDAECGNHCIQTCDPCMSSGGGCNSGPMLGTPVGTPSFGEVVPGATYIPGPVAN